MKIPVKRDVADRIDLAMARFSRSWASLDARGRATAIKTVILSELLGGRGKASEVAGISDNTLDNYRHGKKDPKLRTLEKMAERAGVAARYLGGDWILDGDGVRIELFEPAVSKLPVSPPGLMDRPSQPYLHGYDDIAPPPAMVMLEEYWAGLGVNPDAVTAVLAEGDSMEPTIAGNSPVFIDTADRDLADGRIYAIRVEDRIILRRVHRLAEGGIQLLADNQVVYPPEKLSKRKSADLDIVGRVRAGLASF